MTEISRFLHFINIIFTITKKIVKKVNFPIRFYVNLTIFIVWAFWQRKKNRSWNTGNLHLLPST